MKFNNIRKTQGKCGFPLLPPHYFSPFCKDMFLKPDKVDPKDNVLTFPTCFPFVMLVKCIIYCVECSNKKIQLSATSITKNNFHNNVFQLWYILSMFQCFPTASYIQIFLQTVPLKTRSLSKRKYCFFSTNDKQRNFQNVFFS